MIWHDREGCFLVKMNKYISFWSFLSHLFASFGGVAKQKFHLKAPFFKCTHNLECECEEKYLTAWGKHSCRICAYPIYPNMCIVRVVFWVNFFSFSSYAPLRQPFQIYRFTNIFNFCACFTNKGCFEKLKVFPRLAVNNHWNGQENKCCINLWT